MRDRARRGLWTADHASGRRGEDLAHRFLRRRGMVIVARNYRPPSGGGEIDLIGWDGDKLVFVEVKSRATDDFGAPGPGSRQPRSERFLERAARDYARRAGYRLEPRPLRHRERRLRPIRRKLELFADAFEPRADAIIDLPCRNFVRDPITGRWVIIATDRAKRPSDFTREPVKPLSNGFCPFCYGDEQKTPPEMLAYRASRRSRTSPAGRCASSPTSSRCSRSKASSTARAKACSTR